MSFRVETIHGRHLLCGGFVPTAFVKTGQRWASASGGDREVFVESAGEWVDYSWLEGGDKKLHTKLNFAFQCRYCLVLDAPEVPEELTP